MMESTSWNTSPFARMTASAAAKVRLPNGMRVAGFDGHGDKIQAAGAGVLHINQRIPHAADHTAADGGQHAVPLVHRQRSQHIVRKNGKQHHAPHAAEKEILAQVLEADQHNARMA